MSGRIEIDDAYIGGEKPGQRGRGSPNKVSFVAAVETTQDGRPLQIQLRRVRGFRHREVSRYAESSLSKGSTVVSDWLYCFSAVKNAHRSHIAIVTGGGRKSAQLSAYKRVNTMLGNVKNALQGTFHAISRKHVPP